VSSADQADIDAMRALRERRRQEKRDKAEAEQLAQILTTERLRRKAKVILDEEEAARVADAEAVAALMGEFITAADLDTALAECREEHPEWFASLTVEACRALLDGEPAAAGAERRYRTVSELVDERTGTRWTSHIVTDISRHCAGHFDRGQASWLSPWLSLPLYEAWRQRAQLSRRLDQLGIRGFRQLVAALPDDPREAIPALLARLAIPEPHIERFLLAELFSVAGWASFIRYLAWHAEEPPSVADQPTRV
jgi:uncharacterized protein YbcC (UPF0753/DUF2309 family)